MSTASALLNKPITGIWLRLRDTLRHELWPLPFIAVVLGIVAGVLLPWLEGDPEKVSATLTSVLVGGGADAARSLLTTIAGSTITVTSLTFSLTVVTLQLASSQYTPRMLRTFCSDRMVHWTLAIFLGTFAYSLMVLRTIRSADSVPEFVPHLSVTLAFIMGLGSIAALVFFLAHLAREIRVENIFDQVRKSAISSIETYYPLAGSGSWRSLPTHPQTLLTSTKSGFLTSVQLESIANFGTLHGFTIHLTAQPGDFVLEGTTLAILAGPPLTEEEAEHFTTKVNTWVALGPERTQLMDTTFALSQLADIAARALSPGINDPTTAIHAIRHASVALMRALGRDCGPLVYLDAETGTGATLPLPDFAELLDKTFTPIRTYGYQDPSVSLSLASAIGGLAANDPDHRQRRVFLDFLQDLEDSVHGSSMTSRDQQKILHGITRSRESCSG